MRFIVVRSSFNINGKIMPDISYRIPGQSGYTSVKIFEGASASEVRQLAEKLADGPLNETRTLGVWNRIANDGTNVTLRSKSTSELQTGAKWTLEIKNETKINPLNVGNKIGKIELKFR